MYVLPFSFLQHGVSLKIFIGFPQQGKVHVRLSQRQQKGNRRPSSKVIPLLSPPHGMSNKENVKTAMYLLLFPRFVRYRNLCGYCDCPPPVRNCVLSSGSPVALSLQPAPAASEVQWASAKVCVSADFDL